MPKVGGGESKTDERVKTGWRINFYAHQQECN